MSIRIFSNKTHKYTWTSTFILY